jgi:hypothetical protein
MTRALRDLNHNLNHNPNLNPNLNPLAPWLAFSIKISGNWPPLPSPGRRAPQPGSGRGRGERSEVFSLSSLRGRGQGRGGPSCLRIFLSNISKMPLSPALSPLVPRGEREKISKHLSFAYFRVRWWFSAAVKNFFHFFCKNPLTRLPTACKYNVKTLHGQNIYN